MVGMLRGHVADLAGGIGPRCVESFDALCAAAEYVENGFRQAGVSTARHGYDAEGRTVHNIEAEIRGQDLPGEIVVVGAHYDTVADSPGANDNASGVAALLVLARACAAERFRRTVRFVAFVNEESPFFHTELMGSYRYAQRCRTNGDRVAAMVNLETIGYYSSAPGTQSYVFPLNWFYPSTADFVAFVGNWRHRGLTRRLRNAFRAHSEFPSRMLSAPSFFPGVASSDHWPFWRFRYPAAMITDTTNLRYPHFHTPEDTPARLDYPRYAAVVEGIGGMLREVANG